MPTPELPAAMAGVTDVTARIISAQFSSRPTLRSVVGLLFKELLREKTTSLDTEIALIGIAAPNVLGGYDINPLIDVALNYLASGDIPDFSLKVEDREYHLVNDKRQRVNYISPAENTRPKTPDMQLIEDVIRGLPLLVYITFQEQLATYWSQPGKTGVSRWQWLGDQLRDSLRSASLVLSAADVELRGMLTDLADHPGAQERNAQPSPQEALYAYTLEATATVGMLSVSAQSCDILLTRGERVLLCSASGVIESYDSMDKFGAAWGAKMARQYNVDTITWKRYEPDGNIFDTQAALLLNQQLDDLAAIKLPTQQSKVELEKRYASVTDLALQFSGRTTVDHSRLRRVQSVLPQWLKDAPAADQLAYRRHSLELASLKQTTKGKSWSEGIDTLRVFAANELHKQMLLDQPIAPGYKSDELELTFQVPVGDAGSGYLEPVTMSLTDLALKNLGGMPKGSMTIRHTKDQLIQDWTTPEYLKGLVAQVDIGATYPQKIKDLLLSGTTDAKKRERMFGAQLQVSLPMKALEHAIKGEHGITRQGYRLACALVKPASADRWVDAHETVIRPLALCRKAGAIADQVSNMFVIEPEDMSVGPHLLYRPLYADSLHQFPTREALLAAIAQPGALQTSVLTWISDTARSVYDNGGFAEPHILHFSQLDPFDLPETPKAATLAGDEVSQELLQSLRNAKLSEHLFGSNARALVDLADRESTSNTESRWAILLEGGWQLFNTLLALPIGSPFMLAGWMISLTSSLVSDIPALSSDDVIARELAWIDLLLNIALVLLHGAQIRDSPAEPTPVKSLEDTGLALEPMRSSTNPPVGEPPVIKQGAIGLFSEPPGGGDTLVDFDKSLARDSAVARLLEKLKAFSVPWPAVIPEPVAIGSLEGLYRIDSKWHASVAGLLFRVSVVSGFGEVFIIHPKKTDHPGVKLKTDGQGHWSLDQGVKLLGGGDSERRQAQQKTNKALREERTNDRDIIRSRLTPLIQAETTAQMRVDQARADFETKRGTLVTLWEQLQNASAQQKTERAARHAAQQALAVSAKNIVAIWLEAFKRAFDNTLPVRKELIAAHNKIVEVDKAKNQLAERGKAYQQMYTSQFAYRDQVRLQGLDLHYTDRGESIVKLLVRAHTDLQNDNNEAYLELFTLYEKHFTLRDRLIEATVAIEATWDQLKQASREERAEAQKMISKSITRPEMFFSENLKLVAIDRLQELTLNRIAERETPSEHNFANELNGPDLERVITSHVEMQSSKGYSMDERIAVLETVLTQYEHTLRLGHSVQLSETLGSIRPVYLAHLLERLKLARISAEDELGALIRESEQIPSQRTAAPRELRPKPVTKRVIKTRDKGTLVGDVVPRQPGEDSERVEIRSDEASQVLGSFHEHTDEGVYVEVVRAKPIAAAPAQRSSATVIRAGQDTMADGKKQMSLVERDFQQAVRDPLLREEKLPADWETMLMNIAGTLESLANELQSGQTQSAETRSSVKAFRAQAQDLRSKARQYRIDGYKMQLPTPDKVRWLRIHHAIDIEPVPVQRRKKMANRDFLTEFAIKDRQTQKDLWFAHLHYTSETGPDAVPGHLKTASQRTLGFKDQLREAKSNQEVIRIWRSRFSSAFAQQMFFNR